MIDELIKTGCIKVGNFKLKNGDFSKYYFDMKNLVSYPELLSTIGDEIYNRFIKDKINVGENNYILCGIPLGGLPISIYISTKYNIPMIIPRLEKKKYGTQKVIEGTYKKTDRCLIIEDVITTGSSVRSVIELLKDKVNIIGVISIIDRQQGYSVKSGFICNIPVKSLLTKTDIVRYRLESIVNSKKSRLCFSADHSNTDYLLKMLDEIGKYIVICKIHYDIMNDIDENIKKKLVELSIKHDFLIMQDSKFVDISHIVIKQYSIYKNWIDMVTVHGSINSKVVEKLSGVLLVANMSNNVWDFTDKVIDIALHNTRNVIGFITQKRIRSTEVEKIMLSGTKMWCMTPGISLSKKVDEDQKYRCADDVDTDIIIVGRGIYLSNNYIDDVKKFSSI